MGSTKTGLDIIDSEFNIRFIDPAWAKVYGNPAGKKCYEYFMGRSQLCPSCGIVEALETKKPFIAEQVLVKENNRRIQVTTIPFQNEKGEWLVAEINVDITERKRMEEEVLEAKEDAELYLDIMSHDINNLNQVGLGYLELLLDGEKLDEAHRKYVGKALGSVRGSIRLIENVRLLQQIMEPGEFQNIDLSEVIAEVIDEFSINPYKKVNFNYDYSPKAGLTVRADPLIKEILVNLVGNSIKYSGESVEIGISVEKVVRDGREFYKVCVEDNGDGVPDDKKQTIFRRFERGTKKARGKGLGLYIVKMLVEKYGGEVWVEDRVKGDHTQGARFCYTIPSAAST